ncbi:MAG: hypothetical protein NTU45_16490 [Planctomycetota bacterium]|jgi:hypothetical protein|nr:hypothetical protein [Planctomycetota bacterium]
MNSWRRRLVDLATVTAITAIVWLWAAGQTAQTRVIAFDAIIDSGDPTRLAVTPTEPLHLTVEIKGSRQAVLDATQSLSGRTIRLITGADGVPSTLGTHELVLKDVLSVSPAVAPLGVDVTAVTPPVVRIAIERVK